MSNRLVRGLLAAVLMTGAVAAEARDDRLSLPLESFFARADVKERLGDEVTFYFGEQKHPAVGSRLGEYQSNKKTNAFNKTDQEACEWALLSAMLALKNRALGLGGNAVVGITSNYKKQPFSSVSQYQCGAGALMAGVTMKGEVVKLK